MELLRNRSRLAMIHEKDTGHRNSMRIAHTDGGTIFAKELAATSSPHLFATLALPKKLTFDERNWGLFLDQQKCLESSTLGGMELNSQ